MNKLRRKILRLGTSFASVALLASIPAARVWAAAWNKAGFDAKTAADALKTLGVENAVESREITITAPDIAENGAVVPVAVLSRIPITQSISIIAEKNPFPLAATFDLATGSDAYVSTRLKMGQTSNVRAVVKADGRYYTAVKEVKITVGGCG